MRSKRECTDTHRTCPTDVCHVFWVFSGLWELLVWGAALCSANSATPQREHAGEGQHWWYADGQLDTRLRGVLQHPRGHWRLWCWWVQVSQREVRVWCVWPGKAIEGLFHLLSPLASRVLNSCVAASSFDMGMNHSVTSSNNRCQIARVHTLGPLMYTRRRVQPILLGVTDTFRLWLVLHLCFY